MKGDRLHAAFPNRVANYWNKIPDSVKDAETVDSFKIRLEVYKTRTVNSTGHYWELSEILLSKLNQHNRDNYVSFMSENPSTARRHHIML